MIRAQQVFDDRRRRLKISRLECLRQESRARAIALGVILAIFIGGTVPIQAATVYWDASTGTLGGGNAGGNWSGTNWNSAPTGGTAGTMSTWTPGYNAVMSAGTDGVGSFTINVTGSQLVDNLTVSTGSVSLSGSGGFVLTGSAAWTANSGTSLVVQPTISTASLLTIGGAGNSTFSGVLSGSGGLTKSGNGLVTITGSASAGGTVTIGGGSLTVGSGGILATSANQNFLIGNSGPATVTIQNNASLTVGGGLNVNYQATASGCTAYLNLQGGTLCVTGAAIVGAARMDTSPTDISAQVNQSGGLFKASGPITIGQFGEAQSIYNASGGTLNASSGLTVGSQGDGVLNISGSGNVLVSGTRGLAIGSDPTGATSGAVNLTGGTLAVTGNLILGNGGVGTLTRAGGALSVTGSLVAAGAGTLVLNGSAGSVATYFGGPLTHTGVGTLVVIPQSCQPSGNEAVTFGQSSALTNGILGPWAVQQVSGTNSSGDYLTLTSTNGSYSLRVAAYTSSTLNSSSGTSVVSVTESQSIGTTSAYAVKFGGGTVTTLTGALSLGSGGMILNGGTLTGMGPVNFGTTSPQTGMIFAGSSNSTIATPLSTTMGLAKFGPGTLTLSANNSSLIGGIAVTSGVLNVTNSGALGPGGPTLGNDVLVAAGAELDLQNNIALRMVQVSISGTGVGNAGALHNLSGANSLAGVLNLTNNLQIATDSGSLTLSGPIQGSYNLTKTGTGTLALSADNSSGFSGSIVVTAGVLDVSNAGALGTIFGGSTTTISSGAALAVHGGISLPAEPITLGGSGLGGMGVLQNTQGNNSMASPLSLSSSAQVNIEAGSLTLSGLISGNYALTKTGSGLLVLANSANNFSGSLTVAAGTLSVATVNNSGAAGPLGLAASPVALGSSGGTTTFDYSGSGSSSTRPFSIAANSTGVFQIDNSGANLVLSGPVSGSGGLVKTGCGELTLSGSAGFSGSTCVSQGALVLAPGGCLSNTSSITVCGGAVLQLTNSGSNQLSGATGISLQGSSLAFYGNSSVAGGEIAGNVGLGVGQNNVTVSASTGTYQPWLRFAGLPATHTTGTTVNFIATNAQVQLSGSAATTNGILGGYAIYNGTDFATLSGGTIEACSSYATGNLNTLGTSGTANAEPTGAQMNLTAAESINSLNLTGSTGVTMSGNGSLTLVSGGLIGNTTGTISGGTLQSSTGELDVTTPQNLSIATLIANSASATALVKTGPATLTLSGQNTFTGNTYINQGTLQYAPAGNLSYNGSILGVGNLVKSGSATLTLGGSSTYSGSTTISAGNLCVNGSLGAGSTVTLQTGAVLSGSGTLGGNLVASGGAIAFGPAGNIAGSAAVSSGTLTVGQAGVGNYLSTSGGLNLSGSSVLVAASSAATIVGNLNYASSTSSTYAGLISGRGSIVTLDAPAGTTLTLSSSVSSTYGGVVIQGGTLKFADTAALGSNSLTVNGGRLDTNGLNLSPVELYGSGGVISSSQTGTFTLNVGPPEGISCSYGGMIADGSGRLALLKSNEGTLILSGSDTYTGGTTVDAGILQVDSQTGLPSGSALTVGSGSGPAFVGMSDLAASPAVSAAAVDSPAASMFSAVPEPGTLALLLAGLAGLGLVTLRRRIGG